MQTDASIFPLPQHAAASAAEVQNVALKIREQLDDCLYRPLPALNKSDRISRTSNAETKIGWRRGQSVNILDDGSPPAADTLIHAKNCTQHTTPHDHHYNKSRIGRKITWRPLCAG
jgi:hypothetical protein